MKLLQRIFARCAFAKLDQSICDLRKIRDSYRALNVEIYGEEIARLLNDC